MSMFEDSSTVILHGEPKHIMVETSSMDTLVNSKRILKQSEVDYNHDLAEVKNRGSSSSQTRNMILGSKSLHSYSSVNDRV